jgi:asparagine synthase (glutamine-hydrolysing)
MNTLTEPSRTRPGLAGCDLAQGRPHFGTPALEQIHSEDGAVAAWSAAWMGGAVTATAQVNGDFAVGLHGPDGRAFAAVDRFGMRTLCYRIVDGRIRFAAHAHELADASHPLDPQAIFDYLYFHAIPSPRTIFRGVHRLPPGHLAVFEGGRLTISRYWTPTSRPEVGHGFQALKDEFRQLLRDSVARELAGGGPPACFLSGGTDSSTVAGMIREVTGQAPASYSIGFEAEGYDEMAYARIAARHFGTDHHEYYVTPEDLLAGIPLAAAAFDQPFGNSSALPAWCCARNARGDGVTRLLAGDGGDELFGGNSRYAKQRVFGWYGHVPGPLRRALLEPLLLGTPLGRLPLARKGASYIEQARIPMPDRLQTYNLLHRLGHEEVLTPAFLAQVDQASPLAQQREVWAACEATAELDRQLAFDWRYTLAENDLPKVRMATALAGVEVGFPLLDRRLLEFSQRLPTAYKLRGLTLRWFFKEALRGFLPDEIITKPKHGFGLPFGVWANRHPGLAAFAADSVRGLVARGLLRPAFVETLLRDRLPENPGYYGEMVWISMMLEQWLRHHAPTYSLTG